MSRMLRRLLLLVPLLSACATAQPKVAVSKNAQTPTLDRLVGVGAGALHVHCIGNGAPLVLLDAGLGDDGRVWSKVLPEVGRITRACAYDRLGLGYSSPAPRPRAVRQMVDELHQLLEMTAPGVPYVLVAHSFAGLTTRLYVSQYPNEVAGLVLVDPTTEEQDTRFWSLLPEQHLKPFREMLGRNPEGVDFDVFRAGMSELRRSHRSLGDRPLVVLTAGEKSGPGVSEEVDAQMAAVWLDMHAENARLSSNGVHVVAKQSGHYIQLEEPQLVVAAIREVVHASRTKTRVRPAFISTATR